MKRLIAEWTWRLALIGALAWIGWELDRLHDDLNQPAPADEQAAATTGDEVLDSVEEMRDEIARLTQKVDAILVVMARSK